MNVDGWKPSRITSSAAARNAATTFQSGSM